jgi:cyclopropane fatty-acyl-phospholipid synthase-like methyltransferase
MTMSKNLSYWKNFWDNQSTPLHRYNTTTWYDRYAREINLILESADYQGGSVLETGCGNGALFNSLNINKTNYVGIDLSETLLDMFRVHHPELKLICADSASFISPEKFSLIFSNGVVQYFDTQQLDMYVRNSLAMLDEQGILLLGNMLWKDLKGRSFASGSGELSGSTVKPSLINSAKFWAKELIGKSSMGCWYNPRDFFKYCESGVEMMVFGSLFHPYRISVVLKKSGR